MLKIKALLAKMLAKINKNETDISERVRFVRKSISQGNTATFTFPSGASQGMLILSSASQSGKGVYVVAVNSTSGAVTHQPVLQPTSSAITLSTSTNTLVVSNGITSGVSAIYLRLGGQTPTVS